MAEEKKIKSGLKSSEWIMTAVMTLLGVLIAVGVITPEQSEQLQTDANVIGDAVVRLSGLIGAILVNLSYIKSRTSLKKG